MLPGDPVCPLAYMEASASESGVSLPAASADPVHLIFENFADFQTNQELRKFSNSATQPIVGLLFLFFPGVQNEFGMRGDLAIPPDPELFNKICQANHSVSSAVL